MSQEIYSIQTAEQRANIHNKLNRYGLELEMLLKSHDEIGKRITLLKEKAHNLLLALKKYDDTQNANGQV